MPSHKFRFAKNLLSSSRRYSLLSYKFNCPIQKKTNQSLKNFCSRKRRSDHLQIFVIVSYSKTFDASKKTKFDAKATKCLLTGHSNNTTAYLLQNVKIRKYFTFKKLKFKESSFTCFQNDTNDLADSVLYSDLDEIQEEPQSTSISIELSSEFVRHESRNAQEIDDNKKMKLKTTLDKENQVQA